MTLTDAKMRKTMALAVLDVAEDPAALLAIRNHAGKTPLLLASKALGRIILVHNTQVQWWQSTLSQYWSTQSTQSMLINDDVRCYSHLQHMFVRYYYSNHLSISWSTLQAYLTQKQKFFTAAEIRMKGKRGATDAGILEKGMNPTSLADDVICKDTSPPRANLHQHLISFTSSPPGMLLITSLSQLRLMWVL